MIRHRPTRGRPAGPARRLALSLWLGLALPVLPACTGGEAEAPPEAPALPEAVPAALLAGAWPVRMAEDAARAPFEAHPGWALLFQRDHAAALQAFAADRGDGRGLARTHLELSALYRQAALLSGRSARGLYARLADPMDPVEGAYLAGVGAVFEGDLEGARAAFDDLGSAGPPELQAAARGWRTWLAQGAAWPPDAALTAIPGAPGEVLPGTLPADPALPAYRVHDRSPEAHTVEAADPTTLYLLARWHEAAARAAAPPEDGVVIDLWLSPWRLPVEPDIAVPTPSPAVADAWLFGGFLLAGPDLAFLARARAEGTAAVTAMAAVSPLAAALVPALAEGKVDPDHMLDQAAWLGQQVEAAMAARAGAEAAFHGPFALLARVGALRAGMVAADAADQFRDAGVLRINALDRSTESAADPVFLASVAAWDAGNDNALRAQELVHRLVRRYPPVEAVRYPLDALHIRLSRNAAPAAPVH